jgi:hypothetical protein
MSESVIGVEMRSNKAIAECNKAEFDPAPLSSDWDLSLDGEVPIALPGLFGLGEENLTVRDDGPLGNVDMTDLVVPRMHAHLDYDPGMATDEQQVPASDEVLRVKNDRRHVYFC